MIPLNQYAAARERAAVFDRSSQGIIVLTGRDRATFLHALVTNDTAGLAAGSGVYAAYLTPQGRMITDMRVFELGDRMLLAVEPAVAAPLAARFEQLVFSEDVQARDATGEYDQVAIHGPRARNVVAHAANIDVSTLAREYDNLTSGSTIVVRDDLLGGPGFELFVPAGEGAVFARRLVEAGGVEAGADVYEVLRIEHGRPRFGVDMTTETIPLEAGLEKRAISLTKGCYVGQEVIIRVLHRGHGRIAKRLVRLGARAGAPLAQGAVIHADTRPVGVVTSSAESPAARAIVALGYVQRDVAAPGAVVSINGSDARIDELID